MNKHLKNKLKKDPIKKCDYGKPVTQPDLTRTIRQILVDTVLGRPTPSLTNSLPADEQNYKRELTQEELDKLHDLRVTTDKFDAIEGARLYRLRSLQSSKYWKQKFDESVRKSKEKNTQPASE